MPRRRGSAAIGQGSAASPVDMRQVAPVVSVPTEIATRKNCLAEGVRRYYSVDVMAVSDPMVERRWYLGRQLTTPPSLHVVLTPIHAPVVDDFLRDLREVADAIGRSGRTGEKRSNYET